MNVKNQFGPWFTLSDDAKQQVGAPWGPANPQALNRYSSVLNNPMRWTDPSGHAWYFRHEDATTAIDMLTTIIEEVQNRRNGDNRMISLSIGSAGAAVGMLIGGLAVAIVLGISIRGGGGGVWEQLLHSRCSRD